MKEFNLNDLSGEVELAGHRGQVLRSVRTANGIDVTVRITGVELVDASKVDASKVGLPVETPPEPEGRDVSDEDAGRRADQNAPGATPEDVVVESEEDNE